MRMCGNKNPIGSNQILNRKSSLKIMNWFLAMQFLRCFFYIDLFLSIRAISCVPPSIWNKIFNSYFGRFFLRVFNHRKDKKVWIFWAQKVSNLSYCCYPDFGGFLSFFLSFFFLRLFVLFNLQRASSGMKRASVQVWIFSRCNFGFLGVAKRALPGFSVSSRSCESFLFLFFISVAARIDPSSRPALSIRAWNTSSWSEKKKRAVWGFYWNLIGSRSLWRPRRWWWWTSFDQEEERTHIQKKKKIKWNKNSEKRTRGFGVVRRSFPTGHCFIFFFGPLSLSSSVLLHSKHPSSKKKKQKKKTRKQNRTSTTGYFRKGKWNSLSKGGRATYLWDFTFQPPKIEFDSLNEMNLFFPSLSLSLCLSFSVSLGLAVSSTRSI